MNRREFLKFLGAAAAGVALAPALSIVERLLPEEITWDIVGAKASWATTSEITKRIYIPTIQAALYKANPIFEYLSAGDIRWYLRASGPVSGELRDALDRLGCQAFT